ncbi:GAP1-N1 domain-containing protein [Dysgonomonas alginatilytica]|nr:hypothetical protein [Dysgonomonas alginatilytica]
MVINIDQTLHGYAHGHNLIASSISLPVNVKRILRVMSDMSGTQMIKSFSEYFTAYPINEINKYAFAKTWYAPEMDREGCVWTQTLLIDFADIPNIHDIKSLVKLFNRPVLEDILDNKMEEYMHSLECDIEDSLTKELEYYKYTEDILNAIYVKPEKAILIKYPKTIELENIFFSIWNQQWPRLRRNFSFCTGALLPRKLEDGYLDLQIVPNEARLPENGNFETIFQDAEKQDSMNKRWLEFSQEELITPNKTFRKYLFTYGSDVSGSRSSFFPLVYLYEKLTNSNKLDIDEILLFLGNHFKNKENGKNIKNLVLNNKDQKLFNDLELIYGMALLSDTTPFDLDVDLLFHRFLKASKDIKENLLWISNIVKKEFNTLGEHIITQYAKKADEKDIILLNSKFRDVLSIFVKIYPSISYQKEYWKTSCNYQLENFKYISLTSEQGESINWQLIINEMFNREVCIDQKLMIRTIPNLPNHILAWYDEFGNKHKISSSWLEYVANDRNAILDWLHLGNVNGIHTFEYILQLLDPLSKDIINQGIDYWIKVLDKLQKTNATTSIYLKSFFMSLGMNYTDDKFILFLQYSFDDVYSAIIDDNLDYYSWEIIEPYTKRLNIFQDWDKGKKLRRAIVDKFLILKKSEKLFSEITSNRRLIEELTERLRKKRKKNIF